MNCYTSGLLNQQKYLANYRLCRITCSILRGGKYSPLLQTANKRWFSSLGNWHGPTTLHRNETSMLQNVTTALATDSCKHYTRPSVPVQTCEFLTKWILAFQWSTGFFELATSRTMSINTIILPNQGDHKEFYEASAIYLYYCFFLGNHLLHKVITMWHHSAKRILIQWECTQCMHS
jgi:hypothetical protein